MICVFWIAKVEPGKGSGKLNECIIETEYDRANIFQPFFVNECNKFPFVILLIFQDIPCLWNPASKSLIISLCTFFYAFHELDGKCRTHAPCDQVIEPDTERVRYHILPGVLFP